MNALNQAKDMRKTGQRFGGGWPRAALSLASKISFGFMTLRDIGFWRRSAQADAALSRFRADQKPEMAFDHLYRWRPDPWGAAQSCYSYQGKKYRKVLSLLPRRRFRSALDVGCGVGEFTRQIAGMAAKVRGMDLSVAAVEHARLLSSEFPHVEFVAGSIRELRPAPIRTFDLIAIADVLYYLRPITDEDLDALLQGIAAQLEPGGVLLLTNHCFFAFDEMSRWVRRAHARAARLREFQMLCERWHPFFLTTVLERTGYHDEHEKRTPRESHSPNLPPNERQNQETKTKGTT